MSKQNYTLQLGLCFAATILFLIALGLFSYAFGQEHPFPFKTLEEITAGTPAWVIEFVGPPSFCPGAASLIVKREYLSGAGSSWTTYTDGELFSGGYFPPGQMVPVAIVVGHIKDGKVVVETNTAFNPERDRPCDPWSRKGA